VGQWSLRAQENDFAHLKESLNPFFADPFTQWDLQEVEQLDTAGAAVLWVGWDGKIDARIAMKPEHRPLFEMLGGLATKKSVQKRSDWSVPFVQLGEAVLNLALAKALSWGNAVAAESTACH